MIRMTEVTQTLRWVSVMIALGLAVVGGVVRMDLQNT